MENSAVVLAWEIYFNRWKIVNEGFVDKLPLDVQNTLVIAMYDAFRAGTNFR